MEINQNVKKIFNITKTIFNSLALTNILLIILITLLIFAYKTQTGNGGVYVETGLNSMLYNIDEHTKEIEDDVDDIEDSIENKPQYNSYDNNYGY